MTVAPIRSRARLQPSRCIGRAVWLRLWTGSLPTSTSRAWLIIIAVSTATNTNGLAPASSSVLRYLRLVAFLAAAKGDLKNCQAMKIMDLLGCGGSYTELYAMDFDEDFLI